MKKKTVEDVDYEVVDMQDSVVQEESPLDQSIEIILNRNGVFKRSGYGPESTSMVLAWPRISVDYNWGMIKSTKHFMVNQEL